MKEYKVVEIFSGAGGLGLGFEMDNFQIVCSLEKDQWACDTLRANKSANNKIIQADIQEFQTKSDILEICPETPEVLIGGPPCQGFSVASSKNNKTSNDPRNSLFKNYAQWVEALQPKVFVMENVKGILSKKDGNGNNIIDEIKKTFQKLEYKVDIWMLNAVEYGVPQWRERVFIIGNRYGKKITPPSPTHYLPNVSSEKINNNQKKLAFPITIGQAIDDLPLLEASEGKEIQIYTKKPESNFQIWARKNNEFCYNHVAMKHTKRIVERFKGIQKGKSLENIADEFKVRKRNGNGKLSKVNFNSNYRHLNPNKVSYTIPAHFYSSFIHPYQPRNITAREAARIQSFPDWYQFKGKRTLVSKKLLKKLGKEEQDYLSQYNQIGNAVPPLLAKAVAQQIHYFLNKIKENIGVIDFHNKKVETFS